MGDYTIHAEIVITGVNGKQEKISWGLNWCPDKPARLYVEIVKAAESVGLDVDTGAIWDIDTTPPQTEGE